MKLISCMLRFRKKVGSLVQADAFVNPANEELLEGSTKRKHVCTVHIGNSCFLQRNIGWNQSHFLYCHPEITDIQRIWR